MRLKNDRPAFGHEQHFVFDGVCPRAREQPLWRFIERFEAEAEGPIMHRDKLLPFQLKKSAYCFLRIHVHFAFTRGLVGADRQERDLNRKTLSDFLEPGKICAVATVKNRAAHAFDHKSAETAMLIVFLAGFEALRKRAPWPVVIACGIAFAIPTLTLRTIYPAPFAQWAWWDTFRMNGLCPSLSSVGVRPCNRRATPCPRTSGRGPWTS